MALLSELHRGMSGARGAAHGKMARKDTCRIAHTGMGLEQQVEPGSTHDLHSGAHSRVQARPQRVLHCQQDETWWQKVNSPARPSNCSWLRTAHLRTDLKALLPAAVGHRKPAGEWLTTEAHLDLLQHVWPGRHVPHAKQRRPVAGIDVVRPQAPRYAVQGDTEDVVPRPGLHHAGQGAPAERAWGFDAVAKSVRSLSPGDSTGLVVFCQRPEMAGCAGPSGHVWHDIVAQPCCQL